MLTLVRNAYQIRIEHRPPADWLSTAETRSRYSFSGTPVSLFRDFVGRVWKR